jgi:hypothetical protein
MAQLKKLLNIKCVLWFFLQLLSETFVFLGRNEEDWYKICIGLHVKYLLILSDFNETWEFPIQIFEKYSNIGFHENPCVGSPSCSVWTDGRAGRRDEAVSHFLQFCKHAQKPFLSLCHISLVWVAPCSCITGVESYDFLLCNGLSKLQWGCRLLSVSVSCQCSLLSM